MKKVLISTLGESPAVVTEAIDALKREGIEIQEVVLLTTKYSKSQEAADFLAKHIPSYYEEISVNPLVIGTADEDIEDEKAVREFMEKACNQLKTVMEGSYEVYVSIAGGRKTMSALMTLAVQIYGAKGLFHILIDDSELDKGKIDKVKRLSESKLNEVLHPDARLVKFVKIPFIGLFPWISDIVEALLREPESIKIDTKKYVTDTHCLLWYLQGSNNLSDNARTCFREAEEEKAILFIPVICFFECLDKIGRQGFPLVSIDEVLRIERRGKNFKIIPLGDAVFKKQSELSFSTVKSRDLMLVALALTYGAKLITKDGEIRKSRLVETVW